MLRTATCLSIASSMLLACAAAPTALAANAARYSVTVVRVSHLQQLRPLRAVITGRTKVQDLYRDMMAIPVQPKPFIYMCPLDNGVSYRVSFDLGGRIVNSHVDGSGCRFIHLTGQKVLWAAGNAAEPFWTLFGTLLGLSPQALRGGPPY